MAGYSVTYTVVDNATKQIDAINRRIAAMRAPVERMSKQVSRFVDVSGLRKISQGFDWIRSSAMGVVRSLVEIVTLLGTITGAASIAGMAKLVSTFAAWNRTLTVNADSWGLTTKQVQQYETALGLVGTSSQDADAAMQGLYDTASKFVRGETTPALTHFMGTLGINVRDATGHMRSMNDLMPEVIDKVSKIENANDRAAAATAFLGASGMKVVEAFRASHKTYEQAHTDAEKFATLTDDQRDALERFYGAQNKLQQGFKVLGEQISATLAQHLNPLMDRFNDFLQRDQPQILAVVDELSKHIEGVGIAATGVAAIFAAKWAISIISIIGQVAAAVATLTGGLVAAAAALALVAVFNKAGQKEIEDKAKAMGYEQKSGGLFGMPTFENKSTGHTMTYDEMMGAQGKPHGGGGWLERGLGAIWDRATKGPAALQGPALPAGSGATAPSLTSLPGDMSWGDYGTRANNPGNLNIANWESASGKFSYTDPQTGGAHTMAVYNSMQEGIADQIRLLQRNQDKYGKTVAGALHGYAENPYIGKLGIDPSKPFDISTADPNKLADVLGAQYAIEGRKGSHTATREQILGGIDLARGGQAPATAPAQLNGSVDVSITHKNPPPDSAVTARGSGQVNVAPPRVEYQNFAAA